MAEFMGKTLGTLSSMLGNVNLHGTKDTKIKLGTSVGCSKAAFLSKLKGASSKKDEEKVVKSILSDIEKELSLPNISESRVETCVQLAMCCESLGYSAPFIYIHAIKLAQRGNIAQKNAGYVASAAFLHPQHELVILLVNNIQKDLESSNVQEILLGLKSVCNFINAETVHSVMYSVEAKLHHQNAEVRKLAVVALGHCLQLTNSENAYNLALPKLEKLLSDRDLIVVSAVIPVIHNIIKCCERDYCYLVESLVGVQNQLLQRQIPRDMEHRGVPAPWLQIQILKCFSLLCKNAEQSEKIFPVLRATLQKAEVNHNIAYAIIAEVIETIISVTSNDEMIQLALSSATKFLKSDDVNLKYVGVQSFTHIVQKLKPVLDASHQESIVTCLNHPDDMLKSKTLELLYTLANPSNAQAVCKKIMEFMAYRTQEHMKNDLGIKVLQIANQYNTDSSWYLSTVNKVLLDLGDAIPQSNISEIIDTLCQDKTGTLKKLAKQTYLKMCQSTCPPRSVIKIIALIFDDLMELESILPQLLKEADDTSSLWLLVSVRNDLMQAKRIAPTVLDTIANRVYSSKTLQQIQSEILHLEKYIDDFEGKEFKVKVDPTLSFLDSFVCQALHNGSSCYKPARLRVAECDDVETAAVLTSAPSTKKSSITKDSGVTKVSSNPLSPSYSSLSSSSLSALSPTVPYNVPKKKAVWTKAGREKKNLQICSPTTTTEKPDVDDELFAGLL